MAHDVLENRVVTEGREIERQLLEDNFELRSINEVRKDRDEVRDNTGVCHNAIESGHKRALSTLVGTVAFPRLAYRADHRPNLHPADALANLPEERYSYGLRELAAIEATRGSYEKAASAIERTCGFVVGKRQLEQLVERAGVDVEAFYEAGEARTGREDRRPRHLRRRQGHRHATRGASPRNEEGRQGLQA